jgi:hypothetical protein
MGPAKKLLKPAHSDAVGVCVGRHSLVTGVSAMAIEDDPDVTGETIGVEGADKTPLVELVYGTENHDES